MRLANKTYLGDAVYAESADEWHVTLTVEYGEGPTETIYLDATVMNALIDWYQAQVQPSDGRRRQEWD